MRCSWRDDIWCRVSLHPVIYSLEDPLSKHPTVFHDRITIDNDALLTILRIINPLSTKFRPRVAAIALCEPLSETTDINVTPWSNRKFNFSTKAEILVSMELPAWSCWSSGVVWLVLAHGRWCTATGAYFVFWVLYCGNRWRSPLVYPGGRVW
jgi:hypothetical protein